MIRLLALAWILLAGAALAQDVPLRSGEHAGFARLVLDFRDRPGWRLGRAGDRHELRLDRDLGFDLAAAFTRIDRSHVAELRDLGQGRLALELACACTLRTYELPNEGLVIDVLDGAPPPGHPYEAPLDPPPAAVAGSAPALPLLLDPPAPPLLPGALDGLADPRGPEGQRARTVAETRAWIAESVARAAGQGLVTARAVPDPDPPPEPEAEPPPEDLPTELRDDRHMRIQTSIDRDFGGARGQGADPSGTTCLPDAEVDLAAWAPEGPVAGWLGPLRAALTDATDRPVPAAYLALARGYIALTFGAEARALLRDAPVPLEGEAVLRALAAVVEGDRPSRPGPLLGQEGCPSQVALWALLAHPDPEAAGPIATETAVATFSALPLRLRRHLGPRLAAIFLARDDRSAALAVRNAIARAGTVETPELAMMQARIDLDEGDAAGAETALTQVVAARGVQAAEALLDLIDLRIREGGTVGPLLIDNTAALAFEYRESPVARRLTEARIRALTLDGRLAEALAAIDTARRDATLSTDAAAPLRAAALQALALETTDADFLTLALPLLETNDLPRAARPDLAERFLALDLPGKARRALSLGAALPDRRDRLILAGIAVREGRADVAESYLAGLEMPRARDLRAEVARLRAVPEPSPAADPGPPPPQGALARDRALLEQSRRTREEVAARLAGGGS